METTLWRSGGRILVQIGVAGGDDIRAAGFVDDGGPVMVELFPEALDAFGERAGAEVGSTVEDDAGGFTAGVGIEDVDLVHVQWTRMARWMRMGGVRDC